MYRALMLAAGYGISYCIHTTQGREMAKKAIADAMKRLGAIEKDISGALLQKNKKEGTA